MLHPSTKRLIDKLSEMTRKQRVAWTEGENGTVIHDTEGYRVVLTPEPHAVMLTDGRGRQIETCLPEEFADDVDAQGRPYSKLVGELYREAHRHARGAEKAINALLAGLDATEEEAPPAAPEPPAIVPVLTADAPDAITDETAPLESESETDITHAVASLANQINGAQAAPVEEPPAETIAEGPAPEPEPVAEPVAAVPEPEPEPEPQITIEPEPEPVVETFLAPELDPVPEPEPEPAPVFSAPEPVATAEPAEEEWIVKGAVPETVAEAAEEPGSFGTFGAFQPAAPEPQPAPLPEPQPVLAEAPFAPEPEPEPEPAPASAAPTLSQPISLSAIPMGFGLGAAQRVPAPPAPRPQPEPEAAPPEPPPRRIIIDGTLDLPPHPMDAYPESAEHDPYPPSAPEARPGDLPGEERPKPPEPGSPRRFNPWN